MEFLAPTSPLKLSKSLTTMTPSVTPINVSSSFSSNNYSTPEKRNNNSNKLSNSNHKDSNKKSSQKSDRFIPNRNKMDFSFCHYNLFCDVGKKENEDEANSNSNKKQKSDEQILSGQNRLKEEVFQLANHTPGKRMLSCFDQCDEEPITPVVKVLIAIPSILLF
jgi:hypothetical protein